MQITVKDWRTNQEYVVEADGGPYWDEDRDCWVIGYIAPEPNPGYAVSDSPEGPWEDGEF